MGVLGTGRMRELVAVLAIVVLAAGGGSWLTWYGRSTGRSEPGGWTAIDGVVSVRGETVVVDTGLSAKTQRSIMRRIAADLHQDDVVQVRVRERPTVVDFSKTVPVTRWVPVFRSTTSSSGFVHVRLTSGGSRVIAETAGNPLPVADPLLERLGDHAWEFEAIDLAPSGRADDLLILACRDRTRTARVLAEIRRAASASKSTFRTGTVGTDCRARSVGFEAPEKGNLGARWRAASNALRSLGSSQLKFTVGDFEIYGSGDARKALALRSRLLAKDARFEKLHTELRFAAFTIPEATDLPTVTKVLERSGVPGTMIVQISVRSSASARGTLATTTICRPDELRPLTPGLVALDTAGFNPIYEDGVLAVAPRLDENGDAVVYLTDKRVRGKLIEGLRLALRHDELRTLQVDGLQADATPLVFSSTAKGRATDVRRPEPEPSDPSDSRAVGLFLREWNESAR